MRALVTGCSGFVGRFLTDFLLSQGAEVFGLDFRRGASRPQPSNLHLTTADIQDQRFIDDVMRDVRPDHVYHLAAVTVVAASFAEPRLTYGINVGGALNLCEAIRNLKLRVRMLNVSSGYVYGGSDNGGVGCTEEYPVRADSPYSASKLMGELLVSSYTN
jgi:nucleoside-diphosphate-sugar epimerase